MLGRRVAEGRAGERRRALQVYLDELHETEVGDLGDLGAGLVGEQDVRRLEIAMDDLLLMDDVERLRDLAEQTTHALGRKAAALLIGEHLLERGAVDVLEHRERERERLGAVGRRDLRDRVIVKADDVRVRSALRREHAQDVGLALEALQRLGAHDVGPEHLHDHHVARRIVPVGAEHPALAAFTDALAEVIADVPRPTEHASGERVAERQQPGIRDGHKRKATGSRREAPH